MHKFKCINKEHEVYHYPDALAVFGDGHFLFIDQDKTGSCHTQSGAYEQPPGESPNSFIAGSKTFKWKDVEVFHIYQEKTDKVYQLPVIDHEAERKAEAEEERLEQIQMENDGWLVEHPEDLELLRDKPGVETTNLLRIDMIHGRLSTLLADVDGSYVDELAEKSDMFLYGVKRVFIEDLIKAHRYYFGDFNVKKLHNEHKILKFAKKGGEIAPWCSYFREKGRWTWYYIGQHCFLDEVDTENEPRRFIAEKRSTDMETDTEEEERRAKSD